MYIMSQVVCITEKEKKNPYLLKGFTILDTYVEYTSFPIKVCRFSFKCFQMYAFVAQEIAFWNLWPA